MELENNVLEDFNLIREIIKEERIAKIEDEIKGIKTIIDKTLPETLGKNAPSNFPQLYFDFKNEFERFKEYMIFEKIIGKKVIALGGGFSSGKSAFLNSFLNLKKILPQAISPSTSVPTYIVNDTEESAQAINIFDSYIKMHTQDLKKIAHGFGEIDDQDEEKIKDEVGIGHILKSIIVSSPNQIYENIAFLDTPGYSKPETESYSKKTDENIARVQLNSSDYILWFIQAEAGTIIDSDIEFLKSIEEGIPKLFIVNKADKKAEKDLEEIVKNIKSVLDDKAIKYEDVLTYSSRKLDKYDFEKIKKYIEIQNKKQSSNNFAYNFKKIFVNCKDYYEKEIFNENKRANRINNSITLCEDMDINEYLSEILKDTRKNLKMLKEKETELLKIQDEFFTIIKNIADNHNISMPEPSEIDLIEDKSKNINSILKEYKKANSIKDNPKVKDIISENLEDIKENISKMISGDKYKNNISSKLQSDIKDLEIDDDKESEYGEYLYKCKIMEILKILDKAIDIKDFEKQYSNYNYKETINKIKESLKNIKTEEFEKQYSNYNYKESINDDIGDSSKNRK